MRVIGRVLHRFGRRMLIAECDPARLPGLYSAVVDSRMRPVGKIVDLFGSVQAPYVAIVCRGRCDVTVGEKVFSRQVS